MSTSEPAYETGVPAAVLSRVWENAEYYGLHRAFVDCILASGRSVKFDVDDVGIRRDGEFRTRRGPGRRFFVLDDGRLYVDKASHNGEVTEVRPWFDRAGEMPGYVDGVRVVRRVTFDD